MKRIFLAAILVAACQPSVSDIESVAETAVKVAPQETAVVVDGKVRLRLKAPASEPRACIIPIRIENGLSAEVNVTMIGFGLTGPGEDSKGNMFAPVAKSGEASEARVIVEGQSCDAYDTLSIPEIRCTSAGESCAAAVEFIDGDTLRFSQAG